jgi:hypothetical protein
MESARPRRILMSPGEKVKKEGKLLNTEECPYAKLVGSLLYLANRTRPDIAQSVGVLSRYMSCATIKHWRLKKSVLSYLARTIDVGLEYGSKPLGLEGFCDANHAGDVVSRRSTTGYVFTVAGGAVSWASKLQPTVAFSTVKAKYMAAAHATKEALWMKKLCNDLELKCDGVLIQCDNQGTIWLVKHPIASQRSKQNDISHHFVRERVLRKEIRFECCSTDWMPADFLTKALAPAKFESCCKMCGIT